MTYEVLVTGTWYVTVQADTTEQAEKLAHQKCLEHGIDVELMNLEFEAFDEGEE